MFWCLKQNHQRRQQKSREMQTLEEENYTTVGPKQFVLFKSKLELVTSRAGRQRIAYRAGGHILRKN